MTETLSVHFAPFLPESWLIGLCAAFVAVFLLSVWKNRRALLWRVLAAAFFLLALFNPSLVREDRNPVPDVAAIVLDQSPSQEMGERAQRSEAALSYLQTALGGREDLELRVVRAPDGAAGPQRETRLFESLDRIFSDVPQNRRAGAILITDGQVHDVPADPARLEAYGPVHALLSGERDEIDRRLAVLQAPAYGLVGQDITIGFRVEDPSAPPGASATLRIAEGDGSQQRISVPVNTDQLLDFTIDHAGQNVFELEVEGVPNELTLANNKAALLVNGVRDRLRVLLVSGQPHAGGRTWRDLLTSDPSVDLVHFTIMREPEKLDSTPQRELSLIAFPFRELFEVKLYDFDLIIFDRYRLNNVVPDRYFQNIVRFVQEGGALLAASGPDFASDRSLFMTSLASILPSSPTGKVFEEAFVPGLTSQGRRHPVTRGLIEQGSAEGVWGPWLRQAGVTPTPETDILMHGVGEEPLLILDRVGEGRAAQLTSDHIWLWSRGYEGGGPAAEFLRRIVHWLMKEPELDERALDIRVEGNTITLRASDYAGADPAVTMTAPDGSFRDITLQPADEGWMEARVTADALGVYSFESADGQRRYAVVGDLNPPELDGVRTTEEKLAPLTRASGGGAIWLSERERPDIRLLEAGKSAYAGASWIGLRRNREYTVTGVQTTPALPLWGILTLLIAASVFMWWREGR